MITATQPLTRRGLGLPAANSTVPTAQPGTRFSMKAAQTPDTGTTGAGGVTAGGSASTGTSGTGGTTGTGASGTGSTGNGTTGTGATGTGTTGNGSSTDPSTLKPGTIIRASGSAAGLVGATGQAALATDANKTANDTADGNEDRFLKLLVAQMRNQDPLNPLDNAQVTSQLAQINTVRGIERLNDTMTDLSKYMTNGTPTSSAQMIGRRVVVEGSTFEWQPAGDTASGAGSGATGTPGAATAATARVGFELEAAADRVQLDIIDATGRVVHSRTIANASAGVQMIEWDGMDGDGNAAAAGKYTIRATAVTAGAPAQATTLTTARVTGVIQGQEEPSYELEGRPSTTASKIRGVM